MKKKRIVATAAAGMMLLTGSGFATTSTWSLSVEPPTAADAQRFQRSGEFDEAAQAWAAVVDADPENGTAWFNLGYSLHASGQLEKAIPVHKKAAEFDRYHGIALYNLGCAYSLLGKTDEALDALAASRIAGFDVGGNAGSDSDLDPIREDTRFAAVISGAGSSAPADEVVREDRFEHAPEASEYTQHSGGDMEQMFQFVASRMQPIIEEMKPEIQQRVGSLIEQAKMYAQELLGQFQERIHQDEELVEALQQIHEQLEQDPRFSQMMRQAQAWMEQNMGGGQAMQQEYRPDEVTESAMIVERQATDAPEATAATKQMPTAADAQRLQQAGEYSAAAKAFAAIRTVQPDNAMVHFGYAYNLHMSGAHKEAIAAHKQAAEFEQIRPISLYNLGCAYALTGRPDEAIDALQASYDAGFDVAGSMEDDSDLDSLRDNKRFKEFKRAIGG